MVRLVNEMRSGRVVGRLAASLVGQLPDLRLGHDLAPVTLDAVTRYRFLDGTVCVLDDRLQPTGRVPVDLPAARLLAASPDLSVVVLAGTTSVTVAAAGKRLVIDVAAADSATLLPGGRLLVTAPEVVRNVHGGREYESKGAHRVYLVGLDSGRVLDQVELDAVDASVLAVPHPHDASVVLDAGMGQDGSLVYLARAVDDCLAVEKIAEDVAVASFAPAGDRLLLMPHPSFGDEASVLEWPSRRQVGRLGAEDLAVDGLAFDLYGCFLSDHRLLLKTDEHGILVCSGDLHPVAWLDLPPYGDDAELDTMLGVATDVFAVEIWRDGSAHTTVWQLAPTAIPR
jgi:hypothetical protein